MTEVVWLTNHDGIDAVGPWDTHILMDLFGGVSTRGGRRVHSTNSRSIPAHLHNETAVVVLPARHHTSDEDMRWLNAELAKLSGVVLILCGDEEAQFRWREVQHNRIKWWVQMPDPSHYGPMADWAFFFGNGHRSSMPQRSLHSSRSKAWYFAGQNTNAARKRAVNGLRTTLRRARPCANGTLLATEGFGQGVDAAEYYRMMGNAWCAPAPGGPKHVDTFRFYEALEMGCTPLVDGSDIDGNPTHYWRMVYGQDFPFAEVRDWEQVGGLIDDILKSPLHSSVKSSAWWSMQQRKMALRLAADIADVGGSDIRPLLTAIVTTSPIPSNPSTAILEETLASIPSLADIIIACDGVRPEQAHMRDAYMAYLYDVIGIAKRVGASVFFPDRWLHQANLTRAALDYVDTEAVLFVEHDTPIVTDEPIPWTSILDVVASGHLDVVRLHHEAAIHPDHAHLMVDHSNQRLLDLPIRRTTQWSQRPHVASTNYYRYILAEFFTPKSRTMIEDRMHSVCQSRPYNENRLALFAPAGNMKRSYHLDGRESEPKFDMRF